MKLFSPAAAGLVAGFSLLAVSAELMPLSAFANSNVRDMLNNADMSFGMGETETACLSITIAIQSSSPMMDSQFGATTSSQKAELARYAKRCGLRY